MTALTFGLRKLKRTKHSCRSDVNPKHSKQRVKIETARLEGRSGEGQTLSIDAGNDCCNSRMPRLLCGLTSSLSSTHILLEVNGGVTMSAGRQIGVQAMLTSSVHCSLAEPTPQACHRP